MVAARGAIPNCPGIGARRGRHVEEEDRARHRRRGDDGPGSRRHGPRRARDPDGDDHSRDQGQRTPGDGRSNQRFPLSTMRARSIDPRSLVSRVTGRARPRGHPCDVVFRAMQWRPAAWPRS